MNNAVLTFINRRPAPRAARGLLLVAFLASSLTLGCSEEPSGIQLRTSGLSTVDLPDGAEIQGIMYQISCDTGFTATEYVPVDPNGLPAHIDANMAGAPFADLFLIMPPGLCQITATAMIDPDTPAEGCTPATDTVVVNANATTETVLVIECGPPPVGALDVITVVVDGPGIIDISYDPSKFILKCQETTVTVTVGGTDVTLSYQVISGPPDHVLTPLVTGFTFYSETPGMYEVEITLTSGNTVETFVIPIHVMDDPTIEHCGEGCCQYPTHVAWTFISDCEGAGGQVVPKAECKALICCRTVTGIQTVPAALCPEGSALPDESCEVCCETADGVQTVHASECPDGATLPDESCEVCCETADGVQTVPSSECPEGAVLPDDKCQVCCETAAGAQIVQDSECPEAQILPAAACVETEVCCVAEDGSHSWLLTSACDDLPGTVVSDDQCNQDVCCKLNGNQIVPITDCPAGQIQPMSLCEPEEICCEAADGSYSWLVTTGCELLPGVVVSDDKCNQEVCCKLNGNQIVPITDCPAGQIQPIEACETPPTEICCQLDNGTTATLTEEQCIDASGGVLPNEECEVCCLLDDPLVITGTTASAMTLAECQDQGGNAIGVERCEEVCCETSDGAQIITLWACEDGGAVLPMEHCDLEHTWTANYSLDPEAPCEESRYLVVPSSAASKLAVYDLSVHPPVAITGTPFITCGSPSRILMDAATDVYSTCRTPDAANALQSQANVCKHTREGVLLWCRSLVDASPLPTASCPTRGIAMSGDGRLFVGCSGYNPIVYELDPATGTTIQSLSLSSNTNGIGVYGFAIDSERLYINLHYWQDGLAAIQLSDFTLAYEILAGGGVSPGGYGITVEGDHVWTTYGNKVQKHLSADGSIVNEYTLPGAGWMGGIQAGLDGFLYAAAQESSLVVRFDPLNPSGTTTLLSLDTGDAGPRGLSLDNQNNVYAINKASSTLTKIAAVAGPGGGTATSFGIPTVELQQPYGYSGDMTAMTSSCMAGTTDTWFSSQIDSGDAGTSWSTISWNSNQPPGTNILVQYSTDAAVPATNWVTATNGAPMVGVTGQYLQIKALLQASTGAAVPTLVDVTVTYSVP
jgi:hypothetical protein